jgi:hypothetical protein
MEAQMTTIREILSDLSYWVSAVVTIYGIIFLCSKVFKQIRSRGDFVALGFLDPFVDRLYDALLWQRHYPGDGFPSYIPQDDRSFYKEFSTRLSRGKIKILNSGDGFNMQLRTVAGGEPRSADKADILDRGIIRALDNNPGLHYTRFQITSACNLNWISRLMAMKSRFGSRFQVLVNPDYDHLGCCCTIDPDADDCVWEWQILSGRHYLLGETTKGYGFTYKNKQICGKLDAIFREIARSPTTVSLDTQEDFVRYRRDLWNDRVRKLHANPRYEPGDPEIMMAIKALKLNRNNFNVEDLEYREEYFPEITVPPEALVFSDIGWEAVNVPKVSGSGRKPSPWVIFKKCAHQVGAFVRRVLQLKPNTAL